MDRPHGEQQHQQIPGIKRMQAPDRGKSGHQRALAHITVHPTAHLPKDFVLALGVLAGSPEYEVYNGLVEAVAWGGQVPEGFDGELGPALL